MVSQIKYRHLSFISPDSLGTGQRDSTSGCPVGNCHREEMGLVPAGDKCRRMGFVSLPPSLLTLFKDRVRYFCVRLLI